MVLKKFQLRVEVLGLACYENKKRERVFRFEPFLADLVEAETVTVAAGAVARSRLDATRRPLICSHHKMPARSRPTIRTPAEFRPRSACTSFARCTADASPAILAGTASPTHSPLVCSPSSRNSFPR